MTTTSTSLPSSSKELRLGPACVRWTGRAEGDLGTNGGQQLAARRGRVHVGEWAWLHQVHGAAVHVVGRPGGVQGADGDGLVTALPGVALAVFTADCAPVAFASPEGVAGVAHAGWRGLEAGVVRATVDAMRALGASDVIAALGPCIHPCCYAFGEKDLTRLEGLFGRPVRASTRDGEPALDVPAAVCAAVEEAGARLACAHAACTGCGDAWFSHRVRRDTARQATLVVVGDG
jgi:YfiH family protein